MFVMAAMAGNSALNLALSGLALGSALVAQVTADQGNDVAVWIGSGAIITAAGPHIISFAKLAYDDMKDRRAIAKAERDRKDGYDQLASQLAEGRARLVQLEAVAQEKEVLEDKAREVEIRYEESQKRIHALESEVTINRAALTDVINRWNSPHPPTVPAPLTLADPPSVLGGTNDAA